MGKSLYILSAINSLCCLLLIVYQVPPFLEATDYVSIYRRKQYVIETSKLIAYILGFAAYLTLGCYKSCFDRIHTNFNLKFCAASLILTFAVTYDGFMNEIYHYLAYGAINFLCMFLVYNEIMREWEEEMRADQYIDAKSDKYEKIKNETDCVLDIGEAKRREAEMV
ncbi:unnamed protein product [Chironomus riparius]|uniref:Uncharacterized protein n=1 Tax=Chironomus riparius TaxID=315576 RepID=A0A9N9S6U1_9DIPT|nr:unnamed protein product [Chironomus riparius]